MTPEELHQRVTVACAALREKGFTITNGYWGFDVHHTPGTSAHAVPRQGALRCCALGALIIHEDPQVPDWGWENRYTLAQFVARALAVHLDSVLAFTEGFDQHEIVPGIDKEWYDCGKSIYTALIKEESA